MSIHTDQAYILHTRPYRDTSVLVDFFTREQGRVSAIARGVRRPKSAWRGVLQAFVPLSISYVGQRDLVTLRTAEANEIGFLFQGNQLVSGLYINELLYRLLHRQDPHEHLFINYQDFLVALHASEQIEASLRCFEMCLLKELGYGLGLNHEADTGIAVEAAGYYRFYLTDGVRRYNAAVTERMEQDVYAGASLLAMSAGEFSDPQVLKDAKRLMRQAFAVLLGDKVLKSRELFV